jgi:hypothetical protein
MCSARVRCPNPKCRVTLHVPEAMLGRHVRCGGCGHSFLVPATAAVHTGRRSSPRRKAA